MRPSIVLPLALAACGDPLVGAEYVGTPEVSLGGTVRQIGMRIPATHGELALSVFWIGTASASAAAEQEARLDSGLAEYSMTLFDAPPVEASGFSALLPGGTLAIGVIALYADKDADGALDLEKDLLLGSSPQHLLVFASARIDASAPAAALLGPVGAGYSVFLHDRESACRFVDRAGCAPEGGIALAPSPSAVTLSIWDHPEDVVVPAPALEGASIWSQLAR